MDIIIDIETMPDQSVKAESDTYAQVIKPPTAKRKDEIAEEIGIEVGDYSKDDLLQLWIENVGAQKAREAAESMWRKTALDGSKGEVFCVCLDIEGIQYSFRRPNLHIDSEKQLLQQLFEEIRLRLGGRPPFFIGHNVADFDLKFLFHRAVIHGANPLFDLPFDGRQGKDYYCTMRGWCGSYKQDRISQDRLAKTLGLTGKPSDITGATVWDHIEAGDGDRVVEYCHDDVAQCKEIYRRLNFRSTNANIMHQI